MLIAMLSSFVVLSSAASVFRNTDQVSLRGGAKLNDTIIRRCPESDQHDLLAIERVINQPLIPHMDDVINVLIWGNLTRDISRESTVYYEVNATTNVGGKGWVNGTFHICDYLEKMHQPPESEEPEKLCPPKEGAIFIDYAFWFRKMLVAPGQWSVKFDAKSPEGDRIYCLEADFDLQCHSWDDSPECMRDVYNQAGSVQSMLDAIGERMKNGPKHDLR